jgi:hypothetical protein
MLSKVAPNYTLGNFSKFCTFFLGWVGEQVILVHSCESFFRRGLEATLETSFPTLLQAPFLDGLEFSLVFIIKTKTKRGLIECIFLALLDLLQEYLHII